MNPEKLHASMAQTLVMRNLYSILKYNKRHLSGSKTLSSSEHQLSSKVFLTLPNPFSVKHLGEEIGGRFVRLSLLVLVLRTVAPNETNILAHFFNA